jgi:hypothetical protein
MPTTEHAIAIEITTCSVALLPVDHPERRHHSLTLERRPGDRWVVKRYPDVAEFLSADGTWSWGADVTDEWRVAHWHAWETAVRLAGEHAALVEVNGRKVDYYLRTTPETAKETS